VPTWLGCSSKELSIGNVRWTCPIVSGSGALRDPILSSRPAPIAAGRDSGRRLSQFPGTTRSMLKNGVRRFWLPNTTHAGHCQRRRRRSLLGHVAGGTKTIRVEPAGCMLLPNHAPLVDREQFGTLASLIRTYRSRLGRQPGTDVPTTRAIARVNSKSTGEMIFPRDVLEVCSRTSEPVEPGQKIGRCRAGLRYPSGCWDQACSARSLRRMLGLPFAFWRRISRPPHDAGASSVSKAASNRRSRLDRPTPCWA